MTAPKNARSKGGKRFYSWRNENYWSVTTILGALPKDALINWAKKYTAEYAVANIDTLTTMLVGDEPDLAGAVDWLKNASFRARDKAADLGTYVHAAAEAYALGQPWPEYPPEAVGRMDAFKLFLEEHKPVFLATEASVYNRTQRYAGTLDAIVQLGDRTLVIDYKTRGGTNYPVSGRTNSGGVYPDDALQLSAYRHAEFIGVADGSEAPMYPTDGAAVLHLTDDGYHLIEVDAG